MRKLLTGWVLGVVTVPAVIFGTAWLGFLPTQAETAPPAWEKAFAQMALNNYVARHAPRTQNPLPLTDENLLAGMKIFRDGCAGCHGDPNGTSDYGASFYPNVPQFAKTPPRLPDYQLFWIIRNGVRYSGMSAFDQQWQNDAAVSDNNIWKVATFLSRLESLPPAVDAEWHKKQN
ncbi:MAG: cytochrome c [Acidobacteria bacterium]|nr:cytochrome c [Acidobacteriota bacterium]